MRKLWNNEKNMDTSAEAQFLLMDSGTETPIISDSVIDYLYVCVLISAALYVFFPAADVMDNKVILMRDGDTRSYMEIRLLPELFSNVFGL